MASLITTATRIDNGADAIAGVGRTYRVTVGGTFVTDDTINLAFTGALSGLTIEAGNGTVAAVVPSFVFAFKKKLNCLSGSGFHFSEIEDSTSFNNVNGTGNGFIEFSNEYGDSEDLQAIAPYQGGLSVWGRNNVQTWTVDADPDNYAQRQILENVGTVAGLSVRSIGDLDTLGLADTGFRSLRVRDSSNNAFVADIGTPIDALVQAVLRTMTDSEKADSCGIVEPSSNRYWCFLKDTIYVYSYFLTDKIQAWSTYTPTYWESDVEYTFTPEKFVVHKGRVYAREGDNVFLYGGSDNNTYDESVCTWKTPYLDAKAPATSKRFTGVDVGMEGAWKISMGTDPSSDTVTEVYNYTESSFSLPTIPFAGFGTHFCMQGETTGSAYARVSSAMAHFNSGDSR